MKNKLITKTAILAGITALLASCSTSNEVASGRMITKRKVNSGFHINWPSNWKKPDVEVATVPTTGKEKTIDRQKDLPIVIESKTVQHTQTSDAIVSDEINLNTEEVRLNPSWKAESGTENDEVKTDVSISKKLLKEERKKIKKAVKKQEKKKKGSPDISIIALYVIAFFIPFLAVGIVTDWDLFQVLINLLLCLLCFIPGVIHAFLVVNRNA